MLDDQIGIEPSPALKQLQLQILNQDPSLEPQPQAPSVGARRGPRSNGAEAQGFVGRTDELAQLETLLDAASRGDGSTVLISGRADRQVSAGRRAQPAGAQAVGSPF